jgi:hypothetical protein
MFSVYRSYAAQSGLRLAWESGDEAMREAIRRACHFIDLRLRLAPADEGESRGERARVLFQKPVAVLFEVDQDNQVVRILRSWIYRSR